MEKGTFCLPSSTNLCLGTKHATLFTLPLCDPVFRVAFVLATYLCNLQIMDSSFMEFDVFLLLLHTAKFAIEFLVYCIPDTVSKLL